MKLNEDFFDDNDMTQDDELDTLITNPVAYQYTVMIFIEPWVFDTLDKTTKQGINDFLKKFQLTANYIINSSRFITHYSSPQLKTCIDDYLIDYPVLTKRTNTSYGMFNDIVLEFTMDIKNLNNIETIKKFYCSFYRLQLLFDKFVRNSSSEQTQAPWITFGAYTFKPYKKIMNLYALTDTPDNISPFGLDELESLFLSK